MIPVGIDTETLRFRQYLQFPPMVCLSWSLGDDAGVETPDGLAAPYLGEWLRDNTLVGCNIAYDLAVASAEFPALVTPIWEAYESDRIYDVGTAQKLIDTARGKYGMHRKGKKEFEGGPYSLAGLWNRYTGETLDKKWQGFEWGRLRGVPVNEWPLGAAEYATSDAACPVTIWHEQQKDFGPLLEDVYRQTRAAWWLKLLSGWGFTTSSARVREFEAITLKRISEIDGALRDSGLVRANGSRDTKKAMARMAATGATRLTATGKMCIDKEACEDSGDYLLEDYAEITSLARVVSTDIPRLYTGIIHSHFEELQDTGRTGSSNPNIQNVRRLPGIRECFVARPGTLIIDCDYDMIELRTWAQVCLWTVGYSKLAEALNAGIDVHLDMGAEILGTTYADVLARKGEKEVKNARQLAKGPNFGLPGGMGPDGLQRYIKKNYGIAISRPECVRLIEIWKGKWTEAQPYFDWIRTELLWKHDFEGNSITDVRHFVSNRYRGKLWFTKACNTFFQGLAADIAKAAGFELARRCYDPSRESMLFGCRPVNFVHDQWLIEAPEESAAEAALEVRDVMVAAAVPFIPDVPATCTPALCRWWSKESFAKYDENGRLVSCQ